MRPRSRLIGWLVLLRLCAAGPVSSADYDVPSVPFPTLQDAVTAAAASLDVDNFINVVSSPVFVSATVEFGNAFGPTRHVTVRPGPNLKRATIVSNDPNSPIIRMVNFGGNVTLQSLDILRNVTNNNHVVFIWLYSDVVIERCRIGSIVPNAGTQMNWSNLEIQYLYNVVVRNSIFFAYSLATFDRGIHASSFGDPDNSLLLYNNVVADYRTYGIHVDAAGPGALVLLRNNVAANHPAFPPAAEPRAYRSDVTPNPIVVASHNVALASGAALAEEIGAGDVSITGTDFLTMPRIVVDPAFVERTWILLPAWDPNVDFFRLEAAGPLHDQNTDWGATVGPGSPDPHDLAVVDDLERDVRPGGNPLHTDRGADQVESGTRVAVEPPLPREVLWAAPRANPASMLEVRFRAGQAGLLRFEVFDLEGRRLASESRTLAAGATGSFVVPKRLNPGLHYYRLTLGVPGSKRMATELGKIVLMD